MKNINTGVEAKVAGSSISSGQFLFDQLGDLKSGGGTVDIKVSL